MKFIDQIFSLVWETSVWFHEAARRVGGWWPPINELAEPLDEIGWLFNDWLDPIADWYDWTASIMDRLDEFPTWYEFEDLRIFAFTQIKEIKSWFKDLHFTVSEIVDVWWDTVKQEVQSWINAAVQGFDELRAKWDDFQTITWPKALSQLETIQSEWAEFWTEILPGLVSSIDLQDWWEARQKDVERWIDSAFAARDGLWEGWQDVKKEVLTFLGDPWEYLEEKFADWFLGPEE